MKAILLAAALFAAAGLSTAAAAAASSGDTLRVCADVAAKSPLMGSTIEAGRPTFRWTAEPKQTARRDVVLVALPAGTSETLAADKPYRFHSSKAIKLGSFTWFVVFYDGAGKPLCRSALVAFSVVTAKPGHVVADASIFGPQFSPSAPVVTFVNNRWVIAFQNSPYTGPRDLVWTSDTFWTGSYALPAGKIGFEIHGNNNPNLIFGSDGDDLIYGYGGIDNIDGSHGNDIMYGGEGNDYISEYYGGDKDTIYGGPGRDQLSSWDGDPNDTIHYDANDVAPIDGGDGDTLVQDDTSP